MQKYYNFIDEYTKILDGLECAIRQDNIPREQVLYDLNRYKNILTKERNDFFNIYMADPLLHLSDNYNEIKHIHTDICNLINRCENLE